MFFVDNKLYYKILSHAKSLKVDMKKYLNSLSVVDSANARVMINFEKETVPTLLNALQTINS